MQSPRTYGKRTRGHVNWTDDGDLKRKRMMRDHRGSTYAKKSGTAENNETICKTRHGNQHRCAKSELLLREREPM